MALDVSEGKSAFSAISEISEKPKKLKRSVDVGVGAGAKIIQDLMYDNLEISEWTEQPVAVMRIYFIFMDQFKEISAKGMNDLVGNKEGFLHGLPTS